MGKKLIQVVVEINFPVAVGLMFLFLCWLSAEGCSQWPLQLVPAMVVPSKALS